MDVYELPELVRGQPRWRVVEAGGRVEVLVFREGGQLRCSCRRLGNAGDCEHVAAVVQAQRPRQRDWQGGGRRVRR